MIAVPEALVPTASQTDAEAQAIDEGLKGDGYEWTTFQAAGDKAEA
jgi:hypothetical protein